MKYESRRIPGAPRELIDEQSWAWLCDLRSNDPTKKIYHDINPFAEVYKMREGVYSILFESPGGGGEPWCHLVIGPEKAMLIDTAYGIGDLAGVVNEITGGMPLIVVNTHPHLDHAHGNGQFDKVYCYESAVHYYSKGDIFKSYFDENGNGNGLLCTRADIPPQKDYELIGVENNHVFDLGGGHEIELIFMPGHSPGGCVFLDKKNRIVFAGDTLISMRVAVFGSRNPADPYPHYSTVRAFRDELQKLADRSDEYDSVYSGHFVLEMSGDIVHGMLKACNEAVADPDSYDYKEEFRFGGFAGETRFKYVEGIHDVYGVGVLSYTDKSVG